MIFKPPYLSLTYTLLLCFFLGCGNSNIQVIKGDTQIGAAPRGSLFATNTATIVHVDRLERLVTLRHAQGLEEYTFLKTQDSEGNKTAIIKTRATRKNGLCTADILEGVPDINDQATALEAEASAKLRETYRDPVEG